MEKHQGHVVKFDSERKFGFIKPQGFDKEIFFHIRGFRAGRDPKIGEQVIFEIGQDNSGRPVAIHIQEALFVAKKQQEHQIRQQAKRAYQERQKQKHGTPNLLCAFAIGYFLLMSALSIKMSLTNSLSNMIPVYYLVVSVVSFVLYYHDKSKAARDDWRTPESTLHAVDVLGGWIGATFAHKLLNHKATKAAFRRVFYVTIMLNIMGYLALYFFLKR